MALTKVPVNLVKDIYKSITQPVVQKGTVSSGTVTFNLNDGNKQSVTVAGNQDWNFTGWPANGTFGEIEVFATNAGFATITFPTIQWLVGNGTTSTNYTLTGVTLQPSGMNHFLFWTINGGSTIYGVIR